MKNLTAKNLLREVRKLKKVAGTLVEVWFPSEYFSFGDLESILMDAPIGGKFVNGPLEYHVQGDLEELKFIWRTGGSITCRAGRSRGACGIIRMLIWAKWQPSRCG